VLIREKVLAQAAEQAYWVAAAHIAFPGLGHGKKEAEGYRRVASNDTPQLAH